MSALAWIGALLIGVSLGLLGSGGSILTVPVLVYLVHEPEKVAIAESLAIVGAISLLGALPYVAKKEVHWRSVLFFGLPAMAGTYLGAYLSQFLSGAAQLALFAVVMLIAALMMFRNRAVPEHGDRPRAFWKIAAEGIGVGVLTGLVGVGGGFLIVPALVLLGGLSMRLAIGTSLLIIAMKSFSGFAKYLDVLAAADLPVRWSLIFIFAAVGVAGSLLGARIGGYVPQDTLRKGFALFLVVMGAYILWQSLPTVLA